MKNFKKLLALLCAACLVLSLGSVAFAEEEAATEAEETYDFGGVTIKCFGSAWGNLDTEDEDSIWLEATTTTIC